MDYGNSQFYNRGRNRISAEGHELKRNYHYRHNKHQVMDSLTRSVYGVTAARLFFLPDVLLPCMYGEDFIGCVSLFATAESSSAFIQPKADLSVTIVTNPEVSAGQNPSRNTHKLQVLLFAVCQHSLKLHVLHSHHLGYC